MQPSHAARQNAPARAAATGRRPSARSSVLLLAYRPAGLPTERPVGAAWCDGRRVHWASPLNRRFEGIFNPLPFMLRFPEAQAHWAHFALALEWFDAACFAASTPEQIHASCENEPGWHLNCRNYDGPTRWTDLAAQLCGAPDWGRIQVPQLRAAVLEAVTLLVRERAELQGMPLEPIDDHAQDVGWLHVTEGRRTLVAAHPNIGLMDATSLALESEERLRAVGRPGDRVLWVLPQLRAAGPICLLRRVAAVGPDFTALARGLIESSRAR